MENLKELLEALLNQRICVCQLKGRDCTFWKVDEKAFDKGYCVVNKNSQRPCDCGEWTS